MKLQCQVEVINRSHNSLNIRSSGKYLKSTLALGKEPKHETEYFIIHFSSINKSGIKYRIKCIKQVFVKCINEGKATIRFEEPPHDLCIRSETIQLKSFMRLLMECVTRKKTTKEIQLSAISNINVTAVNKNRIKLIIRNRSEIPSHGFSRTLESLNLSGLKLCNFRRDILQLKHLSMLDLSNNEIEKLPPELGEMPSLSELYLGSNCLGVSADWLWLFGYQITKMLKLLDLTDNKLRRIPKAIWKLQKLVTLKLDKNILTRLPATIGRNKNLRYLTISQNKLEYLPCSLIQCKLEYIDLSSNKFHHKEDKPQWDNHNPWDFYIGSLAHLSSKVVLKNKIYYASNIIPWTLVEFLDNACMCVCGSPVVNNMFSMNRPYELKDFFRVVVFNNNCDSVVQFECYFCSPKCFKR